MNAGIIATRYARAIYKYAAEKGQETLVNTDMQVLVRNFAVYPALRKTMVDPTLSAKQKMDILATAFGNQSDETLQNAIRVIVENGRAPYMESIARMYDTVYRKAKGIVIVHLTTVVSVDKKVEEDFKRIIPLKQGEQIEFQTETKPDIIGGFILEIEDKRLDKSVKYQLNKLKQNATY
ncbi:MAG: F0F1 ATP synthase subunit delta [Candidatus Symbiothrix sp.]|jgi:F-type H+-transporting ATPase subunit delta|nr:F0F1 ATP synthase subunit delta [Candidatus Symbiothrix sp.]